MENAEATDHSQLIPDVTFETGWSFGIAAGSGKYGAWLGEILTTAAIPFNVGMGCGRLLRATLYSPEALDARGPEKREVRETLENGRGASRTAWVSA